MPEERDTHTALGTDRRIRQAGLVIAAGILVILSGWALREMTTAIIPVVLAIFVTLVVLPLDRAIAGRLPHAFCWVGRAVVLILLLLILGGFIGGLAYSVTRIATEMPDMPERLSELLPGVESGEASDDGSMAAIRARIGDLIQSRGEEIAGRVIDTATGLAQTIASAMGVVFAGMFLVLFLVLLALSEAGNWVSKLDHMPSGERGHWRRATETLGSALRRFIVTRAFVGVISALAYSLWIVLFGLDLILVWAILTLLLTFIPNLGAVISGVLPTLYAFLTLDPGSALLLGAGLVVIEQVAGSWVDPRLQGGRVSLSPLVILVAVLFWSWLWGVAGAFLATPMTLSIMIFGNNVTALRPVALLLSNQDSSEDLDDALGWTDSEAEG